MTTRRQFVSYGTFVPHKKTIVLILKVKEAMKNVVKNNNNLNWTSIYTGEILRVNIKSKNTKKRCKPTLRV